MKKLNRYLLIILALTFMLLSTIPAYAETDPVADVINHSFNAYQLLSADSVEDTMLTEVKWGTALATPAQQTAFLNALKGNSAFGAGAENIFADCSDPDSLARILETYEDNSDVVKAFAAQAFAVVKNNGAVYGTFENGDTIDKPGYYLFEDASDASVSVVNPVILKMATDSKVHIEIKTSVPHIEKKVKENSYSVDYTSQTITSDAAAMQYGEGYNDAADYCIGDAVPFELIGTMAANLADYTTYYYAFKDTLSKGLTFNVNDADIMIGLYDVVGGEYTKVADVTDKFTVTAAAAEPDGTLVTFACENLLDDSFPQVTPTSVIVVEYKAVLNTNAVIGIEGNPNEAYIEYSNRPENEDSLGQTVPDEVIVFTYAIIFSKTDSYDNTGLANAEFYMQNSEGEYYMASEDGTCWTTDKNSAAVLKSNANGLFIVTGLDKGTYTITEKTAPDQYKPLEDLIRFTLNAVILPDMGSDDNAQLWMETPDLAGTDKAFDATGFGITLDSNTENAASVTALSEQDQADGTARITISNVRLYDLPGTGGSGLVFIYIAGGLLVAAAVVLIVIKSRAKQG